MAKAFLSTSSWRPFHELFSASNMALLALSRFSSPPNLLVRLCSFPAFGFPFNITTPCFNRMGKPMTFDLFIDTVVPFCSLFLVPVGFRDGTNGKAFRDSRNAGNGAADAQTCPPGNVGVNEMRDAGVPKLKHRRAIDINGPGVCYICVLRPAFPSLLCKPSWAGGLILGGVLCLALPVAACCRRLLSPPAVAACCHRLRFVAGALRVLSSCRSGCWRH
ncbi:hypothetical protein B0T14DRAFT_579394 [Immersiella caudata]|uniref:Uncharacterized protein n=1 Tax=Immersiella caudata TaxID=314043 RepID=A0AA39X4W2_9PEZI|nr:hypothetical protein B0T14DRAFT_579394 [Immersiella caudata]